MPAPWRSSPGRTWSGPRRLDESASARSALDILDETGVLDAARADYRAARVQPLEPLPIEFVV